MSYVDGFVIPIKIKYVLAYTKMAEEGRAIWMKHGALQYHRPDAHAYTRRHADA